MFCGTWMIRGNARGACTIAKPLLRPKASLPCSDTMKFSDLLRIRGNGCAGSSPSGDSTGSSSSWKNCRSQASCCGVHEERRRKRMCSSSSAGTRTSLNTRYCSSTRACARWLMSRSRSIDESPSAPRWFCPSSTTFCSPATRISKNSSRLELEMHRNLSRSSKGSRSSLACSSTRWLNSSSDSSRLMNSSGFSGSALSETGSAWRAAMLGASMLLMRSELGATRPGPDRRRIQPQVYAQIRASLRRRDPRTRHVPDSR